MTTYVLGAGASHEVGYPLASGMATGLLTWMKNSDHAPDSYAGRYPATARFIEETFGTFTDIEDLTTAIQELIDRYENGTREQRAKRSLIANEYGVLKNAVREWFAEIQHSVALTSSAYRDFAREIVGPDDRIITFNYDVSLDRELCRVGKFQAGDGYGFQIEGLPAGSATRILKLHGSTSWLALLFGGMTKGFFQAGDAFGPRPVIAKNELSFLGYSNVVDPLFTRGGAALPVMIFPARVPDFYDASDTGSGYAHFWESLWQQAEVALRSASRVVICGYSLKTVDQRARELLLGSRQASNRGIEIIVACGADTDNVVREYKRCGYAGAIPAEEPWFKTWVAKHTQNIAEVR